VAALIQRNLFAGAPKNSLISFYKTILV